MPGDRLPMRKIRDVLRLHAAGFSRRRIAASLNISDSSARNYIRRGRKAGLGWPLPADLSDSELDKLLFLIKKVSDCQIFPTWSAVHSELKRPGVTLSLLWEEYRALYPNGYGYSHYCGLYRAWKSVLNPSMRQTHLAGEKLFVDYAGITGEVIDPRTGEVIDVQIFVASLGASNYTYAEATFTQSLFDWTGSHSRAFAYFGGVTELVVPDNLRSGITKSCLYDPEVNRTYADLANHYSQTI